MMVQTKCTLNNTELFQSNEIENNKYYEEATELEKWQSEFLLNIDVRKEMEDSKLNTIKQLITFVKVRLNFSCKSTTAANIDLTESRLDNWLKNNHITVDKIYYLRSVFVFFYEV